MSTVYNLTEGSIFKKLFNIALPVLLTSISQMAYNLTDMFWIGRVDSIGINESEAISAIGTAGMLVWFSFGLIIISKIGTGVKISHAVGHNNPKEIHLYASNGLILQLVIGVIFSVFVFIFKAEIISLFNIQSAQVTAYAIQYLAIVGGLIVFQFVSNGFAAINEGLGKTKTNFQIMLIGLILNIILDPLFILVFKMGVVGAATATVISQAVTLSVFIMYYFKNNKAIHAISFKAFDLAAFKDIIQVGLPAGIQSLLFTSISIYIARMVYVYGYEVVTAQRIGTQIEQFTWMIAGGFQTALTVFVGQNFGAKQFDRIKKGIGLISLLLIPYALLITALLYFAPAFLYKIFIDDPIATAYGVRYLKIISASQVFMMIEAIGFGFFNGVGKTIVPSISGIINNLLRIPLAIFLTKTLAEEGIWWAVNISSFLKGLVMVLGSLILIKIVHKIKNKQIVPMVPELFEEVVPI